MQILLLYSSIISCYMYGVCVILHVLYLPWYVLFCIVGLRRMCYYARLIFTLVCVILYRWMCYYARLIFTLVCVIMHVLYFNTFGYYIFGSYAVFYVPLILIHSVIIYLVLMLCFIFPLF